MLDKQTPAAVAGGRTWEFSGDDEIGSVGRRDLLCGAGAASAASFDCRSAQRADEIAICDSRELSQLDVKMATLYDTILKLVGMGVRGNLQDQQRAWLNDRAACGPDRGCIRNLYDARIRTLEAEVARISRSGR